MHGGLVDYILLGEYEAVGHAEDTEDWPGREFHQRAFYILSGSAHPK